jgi:hypothetical protein
MARRRNEKHAYIWMQGVNIMEFSDLPVFSAISEGFRKGRNVREGYARGWGLEFGDLRRAVLADDLYQESLALAKGRTIQSENNRINLFLILKFYLSKVPFGHVVEYGCFRGGSALFMANVCSTLLPGVQVWAFDSFEGMPDTDRSVDAHSKGDFAKADYKELVDYVRLRGLKNVHFVKGLFEQTASATLQAIGHVALNHIDCDIQSSVAYAYEVTKPYMVSGGYIVFDDPLVSSCIGATEVVEEILIRRDGLHSEQAFPHYVFRAPPR